MGRGLWIPEGSTKVAEYRVSESRVPRGVQQQLRVLSISFWEMQLRMRPQPRKGKHGRPRTPRPETCRWRDLGGHGKFQQPNTHPLPQQGVGWLSSYTKPLVPPPCSLQRFPAMGLLSGLPTHGVPSWPLARGFPPTGFPTHGVPSLPLPRGSITTLNT